MNFTLQSTNMSVINIGLIFSPDLFHAVNMFSTHIAVWWFSSVWYSVDTELGREREGCWLQATQSCYIEWWNLKKVMTQFLLFLKHLTKIFQCHLALVRSWLNSKSHVKFSHGPYTLYFRLDKSCTTLKLWVLWSVNRGYGDHILDSNVLTTPYSFASFGQLFQDILQKIKLPAATRKRCPCQLLWALCFSEVEHVWTQSTNSFFPY